MIYATVIGNLTDNAKVVYNEDGTTPKFCMFTVACVYTLKDKNTGIEIKKTEYVQCVKVPTGIDKYMSKGKTVYVSGQLRTDIGPDQWGHGEVKLKIRANDVQLI